MAETVALPAYGGALDLLPSWPVTNVGEPIPDDLIRDWMGLGARGRDGQVRLGHRCWGIRRQFHPFPSKGPVTKEQQISHDQFDGKDPDTLCDDGDQTTYNGMLCASGIEEGCRAVAEAQDNTGRYFRSPHRRWMWATRCKDPALKKNIFNDRCAYGFSPDMNLGVLLYTLKKHDIARYNKWLSYLDNLATTTKLCKVEGENIYDCSAVEWPRVCPEDMGNGQDPGSIAIFGKYGGKCALRPWDTLDFAAVNNALNVAPPSRMSDWDVNARAAMRGAKEVAAALVPMSKAIDGPPIVFMSLFDPDHYPLHLDAVRVLIRMMIRNPGLKLNNLPDLPDVDDALPGVLNASFSDGTDPISINLAAKIIWQRNKENPFFALLALGPTPDVRASILDRCPALGETSDNGHWIWEKHPGEEFGKKQHSMGWDCAFVGSLYNKMRVRKDVIDELLDRFLSYADPVATSLKHSNEILQLAEAANDLERKALDEAERGLRKANDFVDKGYKDLRNAQVALVDDLTSQLSGLADKESQLEKQVQQLRNQALQMPETVVEEFEDRVCEALGPFEELCKIVKKVRDIPNRARSDLLKQANDAENSLRDLRDNVRTNLIVKIEEANKAIADLDTKLQDIRRQLADKSLQTAVEVARKSLQVKGKSLDEARKANRELQRIDARIRGALAVWKNDDKEVDSWQIPGRLDEPLPEVVDNAPADASLVPAAPPSIPQTAETGPKGDFYSIVASFHTRAAAIRQASLLKSRSSEWRFETFLPFPSSPYWVVTNLSHTALPAARDAASGARRTHLQKHAFVLRMARASP
ncbi:hypothetical protein CK221_01900 [Mesorhizobium sp. WSM3868]|nr:hypothetical protein CK221_01900 [Mesorhizobium sp. WSM3868]